MPTVVENLIAPKTKRTRRTSAWLRFEEEIVTQIYGPRITTILANDHVSTVAMLASIFADEHNCAVSVKTMQRWLNICDLAPVQRTEWEGPAPTTTGPETLFEE